MNGGFVLDKGRTAAVKAAHTALYDFNTLIVTLIKDRAVKGLSGVDC